MRSPPDCLRLCAALLCSLLLHAALLLPSPFGSRSGLAVNMSPQPELVLTARLPQARPARQAAQQTPPVTPAPPKPPEPGTTTSEPPVDPGRFYSTPQLSRPPRPLGEVNLDIPEAGLLTTPGTLILTLWIDAQGRVVSFQVDAPDLPEEYSVAVAETFSAVRFAPGEIMGRKVGSILKVEIRHELPAAPRP